MQWEHETSLPRIVNRAGLGACKVGLMILEQTETQASQMKTPTPATSFLTSLLDLPQKEQRGSWDVSLVMVYRRNEEMPNKFITDRLVDFHRTSVSATDVSEVTQEVRSR